jgi:hypothetical protein
MNNQEVNPIVNEHGELVYPNFHDAKLLLIENTENETHFEFELVSGDTIRMIFLGIKAMVCNSFWKQNIVLDITIDTKRKVNENSLNKVFIQGERGLNGKMKKFQEHILQGSLSLVEINPSCGCHANILCTAVKFELLSRSQRSD